MTAAQTQPAQTTAPAESAAQFKKLSLEELMNVEVTSVSRTESTVGESPAAIFVITQDMIRRSVQNHHPRALSHGAGHGRRPHQRQYLVGQRPGLRFGFWRQFQDKLLVQIDGRTLYNPIFSGVYWDHVDYPLEDIERIEVIRGPGASVWGANAVNGIINIITKPSSQTQGGLVSGGGGTAERGFGEVRYGGKLGADATYRVYGKGFTRDDDFSLAGDPHDAWTSGRGGFRVDWQPSAPNTFTFEGEYFHSDAQSFSRQTVSPFGFTNEHSEVSDGGNVLGRWSHQVDKDSSWSVQMYLDHVERDNASGLGLNLDWTTFDLDFQHEFPIGNRQKFIYGAGYRFSDAFVGGNPSFLGSLSPRVTNAIYSAFVQDQFALVKDKLAFTAGIKLEHNSFSGFEYEPTGRLLWTPTKRQTAWLAVSRARAHARWRSNIRRPLPSPQALR